MRFLHQSCVSLPLLLAAQTFAIADVAMTEATDPIQVRAGESTEPRQSGDDSRAEVPSAESLAAWAGAAFDVPPGVEVTVQRKLTRTRPPERELEVARLRICEMMTPRGFTPETLRSALFDSYLEDHSSDELVVERHVHEGRASGSFSRREYWANGDLRFRDHYSGGYEQVEVSTIDGERVQTTISRLDQDVPLYSYRGVRLDLERVRTLLSSMIDHGVDFERDSSGVIRGRLAFDGDERHPLLRIPGVLPPPGFGSYPGSVEVGVELDQSMVVVWRDPLGGVLEERTITWRGGLVNSMVRSVLLPGSDLPLLLSELSLSYGQEAEVPLWTPLPGDRIVDRRFSGRVQYVADERGQIPSKYEVGLRSKASIFLSEGSSGFTPQAETSRAVGVVHDGSPRDAAIAVHPPVIELGQRSTGSYVPIEAELINGSESTIVLRDPVPDCGCLDVMLDRRILEPGEVARLRGMQKISGSEPTERKIAIPFGRESSANAESSLAMVRITYRGDQLASLIRPKMLHLGRVSRDDLRQATGQLEFMVEGGSAQESVEVVPTLFAQFGVNLIGQRIEHPGAGVLEVGATELRSPSAGLLKAPVEVFLRDSKQTLLTTLTMNVVPDGIDVQDWPDCRVLVPAAGPPAQITLPGLGSPVVVRPEGAPDLLSFSIDAVEAGHRLEISPTAIGFKESFYEELVTVRDGEQTIQVSVLMLR